MNRQNFENPEKEFPLSVESLVFMQDMIFALHKICQVGGNWWVVNGCFRDGNNISDGIVVCEDELLLFEGGVYTTHVKVVEEKESVTVNGKVYKDVRIRRKLVGTNETGPGCIPWRYFRSIADRFPIQKGMIVEYNGKADEIPDGWELYGSETTAPFRIIKK